jgi:hypothetical protein
MSKDFISDDEMNAMEKPSQASADFISDDDMEKMAKPQYKQPIGPDQAGAFDRFKERVQDPERWKAILTGKGAYAPDVVQGDAPLIMPGGAIPKLTRAATAIAEAQGIGAALGRTALSAGQGAVMSALDGKEGESASDKIARAKSGAKLSGGIQLAAESLPYVGKFVKAAGVKIGSALTGVSDDIIKTYADKTDEVNNMIKSSGGDMTQAADQVRTEVSSGIQSHKAKLNGQISAELKNAPQERVHSIQPIIERLEAAKSKLNPNFKAAAISDIDEMIAAVKANAPDGMTNLQGLYETKQFLNEGAKSAYTKGGQIFTRASEAARAAKDASTDAREILKPASEVIAQADNQLASLHRIESKLNKNLLKAGAPDSALFAAGSGGNKRNEAMLKLLGEKSGVDALGKAKQLAAARSFANPSIMPTDATGKAVGRIIVGSGVGGAIAGPVGAAVGGALASPMTLKAGINLASWGSQIAAKVPSFAKFARENPVAAQAVIQLTAGQIRNANAPAPEITPEVEEYIRENRDLLENVQDPDTKEALSKKSNRTPAKRPQHFANGGEVKTLGQIIGYPGEKPAPKQPKKYAHGGGPVPGIATVSGDSDKNDTVQAMLSPGEIVLPRSVTMAKNAPEAAAKFVADHLKNQGAPAVGFDKFAQDGASKLGISGAALDAVMQDKRAKQLLIEASDLSPNSAGFKRIREQLQKGWGVK